MKKVLKKFLAPAKKSELWPYRQLIKQLAARDLKAKYKVSILGFFWSLLRPLLTIVVLAAVFSTLDFKSPRYGVSYPVLLLVTYMPWFFFSTGLIEGTQALLSNAHLLKKVYCPRAVFPVAVVLANFINFLLSLVVLLGVLFFMAKINLTVLFIQLPFAILFLTLLLAGIAFMTSVLNVLYRDITQIMEFVVFVWFYLSPVLYDPIYFYEKYPQIYFYAYFLNPMAGVLEWFRYIFLSNHLNSNLPENLDQTIVVDLNEINHFIFLYCIPYSLIFSVIAFTLGYYLLKRLEIRAVDAL